MLAAAAFASLATAGCGKKTPAVDPNAKATPHTALDDDVAPADVTTVDLPRGADPSYGATPMAQRVAVIGLLNKRNGIAREVTLKPGEAWHGFADADVERAHVLIDPMKVTILCPGADASGVLAGQGIPACVLTRFLEERRIDVARSGMYTALLRFSVGLDQGRWGAVIEALHEFKRFYDGGVTIGEALPKLAAMHSRYANLSLRTLCDNMHAAITALELLSLAREAVLADPRVRVRADDARSYVGATSDRFDVVVGDLVVPWRRGESALYTQESFEAVRRVLAPGGLYCQWIPLSQISEAEFDGIAASFLDVYPQTTLWRGDFRAGEAAVALIGHTSPDALDAARADARSRALMANPDRSNSYLSHRAGLWLYFVGPLDAADRRFRSAPRNQDANPWVELASPRLHLRIQSGEAKPFTGRPLKDRLDAIRSAPLTGTAAASLGAEHIEWRDRGAEIWAASLLSFEGDNPAADRLALDAIARLPTEIQTAVLGGSRR